MIITKESEAGKMTRRNVLGLMGLMLWMLTAWLAPLVALGDGATGYAQAGQYAPLREGDTGDAVKDLQRSLDALGYLDAAIDGVYGALTQRAVLDFQAAASLDEEPYATGATIQALYATVEALRASDIVYYAPDYGRRYHISEDCSGLNSANRILQTVLQDAVERGLTPCKFCYG